MINIKLSDFYNCDPKNDEKVIDFIKNLFTPNCLIIDDDKEYKKNKNIFVEKLLLENYIFTYMRENFYSGLNILTRLLYNNYSSDEINSEIEKTLAIIYCNNILRIKDVQTNHPIFIYLLHECFRGLAKYTYLKNNDHYVDKIKTFKYDNEIYKIKSNDDIIFLCKEKYDFYNSIFSSIFLTHYMVIDVDISNDVYILPNIINSIIYLYIIYDKYEMIARLLVMIVFISNLYKTYLINSYLDDIINKTVECLNYFHEDKNIGDTVNFRTFILDIVKSDYIISTNLDQPIENQFIIDKLVYLIGNNFNNFIDELGFDIKGHISWEVKLNKLYYTFLDNSIIIQSSSSQ